MEDIKKIKVGGIPIGVRGIDQVIADMKAEFSNRSDSEVASEMLTRLETRNYIAASARDDYAAAFVREFRKALGQPYEAEAAEGLEVKIIGPGCPRCDQLYERVAKVMSELNLAADLEKVKDAKEITATGVLVTPSLMINGKIISTGKVPNEKEISRWLTDIK
jgi:small redox-active disulfide protein 2